MYTDCFSEMRLQISPRDVPISFIRILSMRRKIFLSKIKEAFEFKG